MKKYRTIADALAADDLDAAQEMLDNGADITAPSTGLPSLSPINHVNTTAEYDFLRNNGGDVHETNIAGVPIAIDNILQNRSQLPLSHILENYPEAYDLNEIQYADNTLADYIVGQSIRSKNSDSLDALEDHGLNVHAMTEKQLDTWIPHAIENGDTAILDMLESRGHDVEGFIRNMDPEAFDEMMRKASHNNLNGYQDILQWVDERDAAPRSNDADDNNPITEKLKQFNDATGQNWKYDNDTGYIYQHISPPDLANDVANGLKKIDYETIVSGPNVIENGKTSVIMDVESFMAAGDDQLHNAIRVLKDIPLSDSRYAQQKGLETPPAGLQVAQTENVGNQASAENESTYDTIRTISPRM